VWCRGGGGGGGGAGGGAAGGWGGAAPPRAWSGGDGRFGLGGRLVVGGGSQRGTERGGWVERGEALQRGCEVLEAARVSRRTMSMVTRWDQRRLRMTRASRAALSSPMWASKFSAQDPGAFPDLGRPDPQDERDAPGAGVQPGFVAQLLEPVPRQYAQQPPGEEPAGVRHG
jgi:hypothetical protein